MTDPTPADAAAGQRVDCFITFGQQYRREEHPTWPLAHPDGWLRVTAASYEQARQVAFAVTDGAHAFDYPAEHFDQALYSRGELHGIDVVPDLRDVLDGHTADVVLPAVVGDPGSLESVGSR